MALFGNRRVSYVGYPLKRLVDVVVAGAALVVLAPIFVPIAIAIKLSSKGPIFFRQRRLGLNERPFEILKFRSMRVDAASTGPAYTMAGDPRVTGIGSILRKTSLDELPQLINVLVGDMSLLGPRPYVGFELERWSDEERRLRASVRPGMSGLAQISGRSNLLTDGRIECDLKYVSNCSLSMDIVLAMRTVLIVVCSRGAN